MYTGEQLINSIITEINELFKCLVIGNYAGFCTIYADIVSKLAALKDGVKANAEAKAKEIDGLKDQLKKMSEALRESERIEGGEIVEIDMNAGNEEE